MRPSRSPWPTPVALPLLAAAYLVTGRLGLLFALPSGYTTAVWPPSGLALAGLLMMGRRAWPGVFLGAFLVNESLAWDSPGSLALAASIATGSTLQALLGATLVRRAGAYPSPLDEPGGVGRFLLLGGPLACVVGATWGVGTLLISGRIPPGAFLQQWGTWWVGDSVGVLAFAPLALVWGGDPPEVWRRRRISLTLPLALTFGMATALFLQARAGSTAPWQAWIILLLGILFTAMLGAFLLLITGRAAQVELQVEARTRELAAALQRAEAASRAKSNFLAGMSHEIRTPMNAIQGYSAQLLKGVPEREQREALRKISGATRSLMELLDDVLALAAAEGGHLELQSLPFRLGPLIVQLRETFAPLAAAKGLDFGVDLEGTLPPLLGDSRRLAQVLRNLLGSAVTFTEAGRVRLRVRRLGREEGRIRLRFEVEDTGPGLESREGLFQPFSPGDAAGSQITGSAGAGLALCRRLVEQMGGELRATSEVGRGCRCAFEALFPEAPEIPEEGPVPSSSAHLAGARVLVVEDNALNREVAAEVLKNAGLRTDLAASGAEAIARLEASTYDAVLMDIQMPGMDGFEATARIRQNPAHGRLPIIALTAHAHPGYREQCLAAGMNDYLTKPIEPRNLLEVLGKWVRTG